MWKTETSVVGLPREVVFEIRTHIEHSADVSGRFEMFLDTNTTCLTDPPDTWSRLVFLATERSAIAHSRLLFRRRQAVMSMGRRHLVLGPACGSFTLGYDSSLFSGADCEVIHRHYCAVMRISGLRLTQY